MILPVPLRCPTVFTHFVAYILDAAQDREDLAARAAVLGSELAGKTLAVAKAPVDDQPGQS
jgi:hypothetical protein